MFPVDPRDLTNQVYDDSVEFCNPKITATDPPAVGGFLYSWSLGDPFLKRYDLFLSSIEGLPLSRMTVYSHLTITET